MAKEYLKTSLFNNTTAIEKRTYKITNGNSNNDSCNHLKIQVKARSQMKNKKFSST